jgi:hypothetical protein
MAEDQAVFYSYLVCLMRRRDAFQAESDSDGDAISPDAAISDPPTSPALVPAPNPLVIAFRWDGLDTFWVLLLLFFALFTRFWVIHSPREVVLSENATITHLSAYHNATYFFDVNPEFAKLLMRWLSLKMQYTMTSFDRTEDGLFQTAIYTSIRSISAFAAVIVVPLTFITIRTFGGSLFSGVCGGVLALVEPSLISPARYMNTTGLIQLFCALSLFFAGLSQHFASGSGEQFWCFLSQGFFAAIGCASNFNAWAFVAFAAWWPKFRFNAPTHGLVNIGILWAVLLVTQFFHLVYAPKFPAEFRMTDLSATISFMYFWRSASRTLAHVWLWLRASLRSLSAERVARRLLLAEQWTVLWAGHERYALTFTNRIFAVPAAILAYCEVASGKSALCLLMAVAMIGTGVGYQESGCCDAYLVMVIAVVAVPFAVEGRVSRRIRGTIWTVVMCLSIIAFLDWAPLIYAYKDPKPFFPPGFKPVAPAAQAGFRSVF